MAERLPVIVQQPRTLIDWWSHSGASADALAAAYPKARRWVVEPEGAAAAANAPSRWWSGLRRASAAPMTPPTVPAGQAQLLWANMMLHWVADPQAEMRRWHELIAEDGFLMFSTLGPGSLASLRALYAEAHWPAPHADFVDMHDLGDMLLQAGFADPVMDQELLTLNWAGASALLAELRGLGGNAHHARFAGLRTPSWRQALAQRIEAAAAGRPSLEFEVVYGHAFRPRPRVQVAPESTVGLDDMRSILRSRRPG